MHLAQVVQKVYNAIHWINHCPLDSKIGFPNTLLIHNKYFQLLNA